MSDSISCTSTRLFLSKYATLAEDYGATITKNPSEADFVLVDTCAFTQDSENRSVWHIRRQQAKASKKAKVIACGCLAAVNPNKLSSEVKADFFAPGEESKFLKMLGVDGVATIDNIVRLRAGFLGNKSWQGTSPGMKRLAQLSGALHQINTRLPFEKLPIIKHLLNASIAANEKAYALSISQGCLGNCSFCVIPVGKGKTKSVPAEAILAHMQRQIHLGVTDFVLNSEDTGAYGVDLDTNIIELLNRMHDLEGNYRIYIQFFDPRWLKTYFCDLLPILNKGKIRYLQLPVQSASDSVLLRMRRCYQFSQVIPYFRALKNDFPNLTLGTQLIVGFPGESREDHEANLALIQSETFHWVDLFPFSARPGADASKFADIIPTYLIKKRTRELKQGLVASILSGLKRKSSSNSNLAFQLES